MLIVAERIEMWDKLDPTEHVIVEFVFGWSPWLLATLPELVVTCLAASAVATLVLGELIVSIPSSSAMIPVGS